MKASGTEISARLKIARTALALNQREFASKSGVGFSTYQKYELGMSVPGGDAIEGFVRLGFNANWLLTGEGPMLLSELLYEAMQDLRDMHSLQKTANRMRAEQLHAPYANTAFVSIPLYNVTAAAGGGVLVDQEHVIDMLQFSEAWIRQALRAAPADLYLIYVDGESMEPTLRSGDVLLLDRRATKPDREGVYIMRMNGMLLVKRLQALPGGIIKVTSDNAAYDPFTVRLAEMQDQDFAILGRVVWSGRRM